MLGRYTCIDVVDLVDGEYTYYDCYLLTGDGVPSEFEVDLTGDFFFNELIVANRKTVKHLSDIQDLFDFLDSEGISYREYCLTPDTLLVGGGKDCIIQPDLTFDWEENINACSQVTSDYVRASLGDAGLLGYGIDYRDMHTALHGIMWTPDKSLIKQIERICQELTSDNLPKDDYYEYWGELEGYFASNELFDEEEINFRDITSDNKYYCGDGYIQIINPVAFDLYF